MANGGLARFGLSRFALKRLLVALLVVAAVAAHVVFWYVPRERPAAVDADSLPGRLLLASELPYRLWLPYPHQNLGRLESSVEDAEAWVAAVGRLLGSPATELPRFGPFRFPPARAMTIASDREGKRSQVAVSVYPAIALVARLAGRIAGNPLLAGGEVLIDDRPFFVHWRGSTWLLGSEPDPRFPAAAGPGLPDSLAWLVVEDLTSAIPPGRYRLRRGSGDLSLSSFVETGAAPGFSLSSSLELGPALTRDWAFLGLREGGTSTASWMLLLQQEIGDSLSLPDGGVLYRDTDRRWSLPGEGLARILDLDLERGDTAGWSLVAISSRGRAAAEELGSALERSPRDFDLEQSFWVRPSYLIPMVDTIHRVLDAVPIVSRKEVDYWADLTVALAPLMPFQAISLEVEAEGHQAELRLWSTSPWLHVN